MSASTSIDAPHHREALDSWLDSCKSRMAVRFPSIDFESDIWRIRTLYKTEQPDFFFRESFLAMEKCDRSYREVCRCLMAEFYLSGKAKETRRIELPWRKFASKQSFPVWDLRIRDLRDFEAYILDCLRKDYGRHSFLGATLAGIEKHILILGRKGVMPVLGYRRLASSRQELLVARNRQAGEFKDRKSKTLDRQMEAFNEAFNAFIENPVDIDDKLILSTHDCLAMCAVTIGLCAPSRINEILTMSCDDYAVIEDYLDDPYDIQSTGASNATSAHQMLVITQKGSKGAEWAAKPALNFMIEAFNYCIERIKQAGARSRMLVRWYEQHPDKLYLPHELEHLRGGLVTCHEVAQIIRLSPNAPSAASDNIMEDLRKKCFLISNPKTFQSDGKINNRHKIYGTEWDVLEEYLLKKVHKALESCRKVTAANTYQGKLSNMLFLCDNSDMSSPYLPKAVNYQTIRKRLKRLSSGIPGYESPPTIFEKLNITIPENGQAKFASMALHDMRRWLTTQAQIHGENLSDVVINKWANRSSLAHLKAYDFRAAESTAQASSMPETQETQTLSDFSNGMEAVEKLEDQFGLERAIVTAHDAEVAFTSMEAISQAVEDRPIATCSQGIIVLYPTLFGACVHQHHEKPCRNYSNDICGACMGCDKNFHVKGHKPTNDETRARAEQLFEIIIRHLENLAFTYNRGVADDPAALGDHMVTLVENGLDRKDLEELANHLVDHFFEVRDLLKDRQLANRLEEAFVARGVVTRLDDVSIKNGAIIKYHAPLRHAEPPLELALEDQGGREEILAEEAALIEKYPVFSPEPRGTSAERNQILPDKVVGDI